MRSGLRQPTAWIKSACRRCPRLGLEGTPGTVQPASDPQSGVPEVYQIEVRLPEPRRASHPAAARYGLGQVAADLRLAEQAARRIVLFFDLGRHGTCPKLPDETGGLGHFRDEEPRSVPPPVSPSASCSNASSPRLDRTGRISGLETRPSATAALSCHTRRMRAAGKPSGNFTKTCIQRDVWRPFVPRTSGSAVLSVHPDEVQRRGLWAAWASAQARPPARVSATKVPYLYIIAISARRRGQI